MKISLDRFGGIAPILDGRMIGESVAQIALNTDFESGKAESVGDQLTSGGPIIGANTKTVYKRGNEWLTWDTTLDIVGNIINNDEYNRIFFTGDGDLKELFTKDGTTETRSVSLTKPETVSAAVTRYFSIGSGNVPSLTPRWGGDQTNSLPGTFVSEDDGIITCTYAYPGYAAGLVNSTLNTGKQMILPNGKAAIKSTRGVNFGIDFSDGKEVQEEFAKIYVNSDLYYAKLEATEFAYSDANTSYDGSPEAGKKYTTICYPCTVTVKYRLTYVENLRRASYAATYVDDLGQEGPPSEASESLEYYPGDTVVVTIPRSTETTTDKIRLYRTGGDEGSADFYYLDETDNPADGNWSYTDSKTDDELAEPMPRAENALSGMHSLNVINGALVAAKGQDVFFSDPYLPYSWKSEYNYTVGNTIVGLATSGNSVFVLTKAEPEILCGSHPESMAQVKCALKQSCASKESIVTHEGAVFYASPDGMVQIMSDGTGSVITKNHFSREQWQALAPTTMKCACHDTKLYIFTAEHGVYVIDFTPDGIQLSQQDNGSSSSVIYEDIESDTLWVNGQGWCAGSGKRTMTWRSRIYHFDVPVTWSCAKLAFQNSESFKFRLYTTDDSGAVKENPEYELNGSFDEASSSSTSGSDSGSSSPDWQYTAENMENDKAFRLPFLRRSREWVFEIETAGRLLKVDIAQSMGEIR